MHDISNNPAGRLQAVLKQFHQDDNGRTLTTWWGVIAESVAPGKDSYSVRAEAGALLRDVEMCINYLSSHDDKGPYLGQREAWSIAVFGWGLNAQYDTGENVVYKGTQVVSVDAISWLGSLSSILQRDAPEHTIRLSDLDLEATIESILGKLGVLLDDVLQKGEQLPAGLRAALIRSIVSVQDDIHYLQLRGWRRLYASAAASEATLTVVADDPMVAPSTSRLETVRGWVRIAREICADVERIVAPTATGIAVAITTSDVATGLGAGISARMIIDAKLDSPPKALPPGDGTSAQ